MQLLLFYYNFKSMSINTLAHVLSTDECEYFKNTIDNKKIVNNFTNSGVFKNDKFVDLELATKLFNTIPKDIISKYKILRPNNLIMTGMYTTNQAFGIHTDTGLYYNKETKESSNFTYLIYLNDDFEGGETQFYDEYLIPTQTIYPETGKGLLFDISLNHKGSSILSGNKYWIGIELISKFNY
jgi:prolyl 4-hydroxylase